MTIVAFIACGLIVLWLIGSAKMQDWATRTPRRRPWK